MVYVDPAVWEFKGKFYCHLIADSLEELHEFAFRVGVKRCWFEYSKTGIPHYDLSEAKRTQALKAGAIEVGLKNMGIVMRHLYPKT